MKISVIFSRVSKFLAINILRNQNESFFFLAFKVTQIPIHQLTILIFVSGLKCKECKFKCHRDCEPRVPPSCSLPDDLADFYFRSITKDGSPILPPRIHNPSSSTIHTDHPMRMGAGSQAIIHPYPESSSNTSSCNSSTPSSPAVVVTSQSSGSHSATIYQNRCGNKFTFPDPPHGLRPQDPLSYHLGQPPPKVTSPNSIIDSVKSCDSDKTLSGKIPTNECFTRTSCTFFIHIMIFACSQCRLSQVLQVPRDRLALHIA